MNEGIKLSFSGKIPVDTINLDTEGSLVSVVHMNPAEAYDKVPELLQEYINNGSEVAWSEICRRIDNIYVAITITLDTLDDGDPFSAAVIKQIATGKKLIFKPNMVMLPHIHMKTHGAALNGVNSNWEFVAAVMRWFHDKKNISYHQMALGEAGTTTDRLAISATKTSGNIVTTQAIMEGKYGKDYGGWGFYFVRKYLAERHEPGHTDNPMSGYDDSLLGNCIPPGMVNNKLLLYDLNKIGSDGVDGREVPVADGVNLKEIILHKVLVGGNPNDKQDMRNWPGCILVNLSKAKIHLAQLYTGALKNIGIGFYPMEARSSGARSTQWKYAIPHLAVPSVKMGVPHHRWLYETDQDTGKPLRNNKGEYKFVKTGGIEAGIADSIQAVKGQNVKIIHIIDAIEIANIAHIGPMCKTAPEGLIFAGNDPVALDVCVAHYMFNMVPMNESDSLRKKYKFTSDIIQKTPMPLVKDRNIITGTGFDEAFVRYNLFKYCENRGLGRQLFHVTGEDLWQGGSIASYKQHLGCITEGIFEELLTTTLYHTPNKPLWDLQAAIFSYLELNDNLTGADFKQKIMRAYDENGDGIIDYMETGKSNSPYLMSFAMAAQDLPQEEMLKFSFLLASTQLKLINKEWNENQHDIGESGQWAAALSKAFVLSHSDHVETDPLFPERRWGKGWWPSFQFAIRFQVMTQIYGQMFPVRFDPLMSPYGYAFTYADVKHNCGAYSSNKPPDEDIIGNYHRQVAAGGTLLPFTLYVPTGHGSYGDKNIPNIKETNDPELIFTAEFNGEEYWRELRISEYNLK